MKNWKTTLFSVLAVVGHSLSDFPGLVGQIAKTVFGGAIIFLGGTAADAKPDSK